ncbi:hypothetical protein Snoj_12540 [Streptomyces nojiriensis]|uniref:Uncharacterized protein n=1 Tax=Streptomyces nojiriensis TaxID=66374 RepID=A0ABQ3SGT6_9ACTN|nr:hypothetical protein [Streptomyces nojiriensis]QTI48967.1 hypothetical protein JYK04_06835 [Streptomyces nojiriensis]GGS08487.1 hypothetical protein GCM10010205_42360 [Streptomyces nojiriensis]GHI67336.1 hypothetical protein Snoj_12540 [Streptomyces nojiriensis]
MTQESSIPPVWFRLPPGFHDIGPGESATLNAFAEALGSQIAQEELSQLMDGLEELAGHDVVYTAFGFHPEEPVGVTTSLFSLTIRRVEQPNPRLAVARTALAIARSTLWTSSVRRFIDLPSALPCCLVTGIMSVPDIEHQLFQARVATVHPDGLHLLVLDLTSACTDHAAAYTDILEAVAHTLQFTDPDPSVLKATGTSRILEVLL